MSGSTIAAWLVTGFAPESAVRINAAADLVEAGVPVAEAARVLAGRFGCSVRQGRRYAGQAAQAGRAEIPQDTVVRSSSGGAGRAGARACPAARPISAVVAQALEEYLARDQKNIRAGEQPEGRGGVRLRPERGHRFVGGLRHIGSAAAGPHRAAWPGRTRG